MKRTSRRQFLRFAASATLAPLAFPAASAIAASVVIVGGGFAGATAARQLKQLNPSMRVTLVEYNHKYVSFPASNWVLGGLQRMDSLLMGYRALDALGVNVLHDWVEAVDAGQRQIHLAGGDKLKYDRLIVAPGVDFRWEEIEGYSPESTAEVPHAWSAGEQITLLKQQLMAMPAGGTFVMSLPDGPHRSPTAAYERASLVANFFRHKKPGSKVIILDAKQEFPNQLEFVRGWQTLYGFHSDKSVIEWHGGSSGDVGRIDVSKKTAYLRDSETAVQGSVLNIVPPQKAGKIAQVMGLADASGWCPVRLDSWESTLIPGVHVIGDAAGAHPLSKSAYSAVTQAKLCANAVHALLAETEINAEDFSDTSYSLVGPDYGIKDTHQLTWQQEGRVLVSQEVSGAEGASSSKHARDARSWWSDTTNGIWG